MSYLPWLMPGVAFAIAIYTDTTKRIIPKSIVIPLLIGGFVYSLVFAIMSESIAKMIHWPFLVILGFVAALLRSKYIMPLGGGDLKLIVALCGWMSSYTMVFNFIIAGMFFTAIGHLINHSIKSGLKSVLFNLKAEVLSCGQLIGDYKPMPGAYAICFSYYVTMVLQSM